MTFSAESRSGRRIVGFLERGADLLPALLAVCERHDVRSGQVTATGALERAELDAFDQDRLRWAAPRAIDGALELLGFSGSVAEHDGALRLDARVTLMRERDVGAELLGGHLAAARVFGVEYVIESFDDVILRRRLDPRTGLDRLAEAIALDGDDHAAPPPVVAAPPPPVPAPAPARAATPAPAPVAAAPARRATPASPTEDVVIHPGDVLVHPKFGRCTVVRLEGQHEFAHVQLRNARVVRLSLEIMTLRQRGTEDGQRVFDASIE